MRVCVCGYVCMCMGMCMLLPSDLKYLRIEFISKNIVYKPMNPCNDSRGARGEGCLFFEFLSLRYIWLHYVPGNCEQVKVK